MWSDGGADTSYGTETTRRAANPVSTATVAAMSSELMLSCPKFLTTTEYAPNSGRGWSARKNSSRTPKSADGPAKSCGTKQPNVVSSNYYATFEEVGRVSRGSLRYQERAAPSTDYADSDPTDTVGPLRPDRLSPSVWGIRWIPWG